LLDENDKSLCVIDLDTVMPGYIHYDFGDAIRTAANTAEEDEKEFPKDFVKALGQNNYLGIPLPKSVGGRGLNTVCAILAEEELGALAFPLGCAMGMSTYLCRAIYKYGTSELWKKYIVPTMTADLICAEGITEPLKGSDIARLQTVAKREESLHHHRGKAFSERWNRCGLVSHLCEEDDKPG
jgi:alkylation response protein AidB-like acyl-CoA dehydrogenase